MKKLLTLLLFVMTFYSFGQSRMDYSRVNTVSQVGDTLVVKFQYFKGTDSTGADMPDATLYQFDFQYNNKLLSLISRTWQPQSTSAQKAYNSWNGYKFAIDDTKNQTDFDGQYISWLAGDATYNTDSDWSVERLTYQDVTSLGNGDEFIKYEFKIKDKGLTNYTDYSDIINANWVNYKESDGTQIDATGQSSLSLSNIQGGDAGDVTLSVSSNVITNNIGDGTDFGYTIYTQADYDAGLGPDVLPVASVQFDASGEAIVQGLENDTQYVVFIHIDDQKEYLDDSVTVSDLALIFKEAIGAGDSPNGSSTTWDYYIQKLLGNIVDMQSGVTFADSYEVLAYLQGVDSGNQHFISKAGNAYNVSGIKSTFGDGNTSGNPTFDSTIKPTDSDKSFEFAHALAGDVNFSHGFEPTSTAATISNQSTTARSMMIAGEKFQSESANIDLVSELVDGQVVFSINSQVSEMVGTQFNIKYDTTRLKLIDVVFDTGNDMTNFANHKEGEGKVNIGSFDQNFTSNVKQGTPYKLIFEPLVSLQNTSGLVTFKVQEGVKADGTQIKLIME